MRCFLFHKWTKWVFRVQSYTRYLKDGGHHEFTELRQRRTCEKCGFTQDEEIEQ